MDPRDIGELEGTQRRNKTRTSGDDGCLALQKLPCVIKSLQCYEHLSSELWHGRQAGLLETSRRGTGSDSTTAIPKIDVSGCTVCDMNPASKAKARKQRHEQRPVRTRPRPLPPGPSTIQCDVIAIDVVAPIGTAIDTLMHYRQLPVPL